MNYDMTLTDAQLRRMLELIDPAWQLRGATHTETGHHAVARPDVETPDGQRSCYLKATRSESGGTTACKARHHGRSRPVSARR